MSAFNKWIFGGLGWALGGPIGGILGFALGAITEESGKTYKAEPQRMLPNDFSAALLVLCAAVMKADQKVMRSERFYGAVSRSFQLPADIDAAQSKARYDNGILTLTLPKRVNDTSRRLSIE